MENKSGIVRTRFAPSPTGELHIGGARTALFSYLLAKKNKGQFILRIEDTDVKRNQEEFVNNLYEDLLWLGLKPDESIFQLGDYGPYRQTERLETYKKHINQLIQEKKAYYCFCSQEELTQEKEDYKRINKKSNYQYSRKCLKLSEKEINSLFQTKIPFVLRLKVPQEKSYKFSDLVRGEIEFQGRDIEDFVLLRQNGIPNYNFSCAVDDHLMKISHVLRGEEHLSNTAKQLVLYDAFKWKSPLFGHLSIILNKEKKKLSKRDQETSQFQLIKQLRQLGYLPQAIVNYLIFLGWHPGKIQEIFSLDDTIKQFNLEGLHKRGAVYSLEKLNWYNNHYIQQLELDKFREYSWKILKGNYKFEEEKRDWVQKIALLFQPQLNYFQELAGLTSYFFQKPKKESKISPNQILELNELKENFEKLEKWEEKDIKNTLKVEAEKSSISKKEFFLLIRNTITGQNKGPELPKIIFLLGKKEVVKRIKY